MVIHAMGVNFWLQIIMRNKLYQGAKLAMMGIFSLIIIINSVLAWLILILKHQHTIYLRSKNRSDLAQLRNYP